MIRSATLPLQTTLPSLSDNSRLKLFSGSANVNLSRE
ncbi:MAG: phosphoribosylpyrophosphate synthetase, partial [Cyanobacteria bacterium J06607_6]